MFAGVVLLLATVSVGKVTDGYVWMMGWLGMGGRGWKVRYSGEGTMGVIGIISSSLFLRL